MRTDLAQTLRGLISSFDDWLGRFSDEFNPFEWRNSQDRLLRRKAFTESGLYLYIVQGLNSLPSHPELVSNFSRLVNDHRFTRLVLRSPREFLLYSSALLYAKTSGIISHENITAIERVLNNPSLWSEERVPYRYLDLWHFCRVYGFYDHRLDIGALIRLGCIGNRASFIECNLNQAYAFTHSVFYYYNFGIKNKDFDVQPLRHDFSAFIVALILRFIADNNLDVALELVLSGALLRQLPKPIIEYVLNKVIDEIQTKGFIEAPEAVHCEGISFQKPESIHWAKNYHTVLVAGAALRLLLRDWDLVDENIPSSMRNEYDFEDLFLLGHALRALNNYELSLGAELVIRLSHRPVKHYFSDLFAEVRHFILAQMNSDGYYGFFVDEEAIYSASTSDVTFEEAVLRPTFEACSVVLKDHEEMQ